MSKSPRLSVKEAIDLIESEGFVFIRQSGSHAQYYREGVRITLPIHSNTILHPKIVKQIYVAIESLRK
ncbi:MAG: type II toxin-antitoxin system HicA family toxin [Candidatus Yonathbacteria bacterium]|nr:type II toxin-antitoxin system HicA family toxin [Candidatus Yonathbacteria bacterium]